MTLPELIEPLFQYICRLNRLARKSGAGGSTGETALFTRAGLSRSATLSYDVVRAEIRALFEDMQQKSAGDFRLNTQFKKLEMPLLFFVDSLIAESGLPFAAQWNQNRLAYDRNELAGDEKLFDLLEEDLKDSSEEASERLAIYYQCLGLGFCGMYFKQPEYLRGKMQQIAPRIRRWLDADEAARICADAYEGVDTRDLTQRPSHKLLVIGIIFLCFTFAALVSYVYLYRQASHELNQSLSEVLKHDLNTAAK